MLIDTHAHLNFDAYKNDVHEVIQRSLNNNVWMINVGSQFKTSKKAIEIAEKYSKGVYAAIGLHPIHVQDEFNYHEYKKLAGMEKTIAIGETGLDYKAEYFPLKEKQEEIFLSHLKLAEEFNLPIIFHCRMAHNELIEILKKQKIKQNLQGVVHCFTGNWQQAKEYLKIGLYLGFNGIIFKMDLNETIKKIPLDKILIETDCPYLSLPTIKGRNEPMFVKHIAEKIAEIKGKSFQEIAEKTTENAKTLFYKIK